MAGEFAPATTFLRAAKHALRPQATTAGGVGVTDAVFLVFRKQLTVAAVKAVSKLEIVELSAERFIFCAVPNVCQGPFFYIAERAVGDLPADSTHVSIAVVQQGHAGADRPHRPGRRSCLPAQTCNNLFSGSPAGR